jgi:hypothetical protein
MKDLESLSSFFDSSQSKQTLRKAQLAFQIEKKIEEDFSQTVKVIIGRAVTLVCQDAAQISFLKMRQKKIELLISSLFGEKDTHQIRFRIKE